MENINVYVRVRPFQKENESNFKIEQNTLVNKKTNESFRFSDIFPTTAQNEQIFEAKFKDNLSFLLQGINISIFAYGQTSTGKTFTMKGKNHNLNGIIPLSIKEIFSKLSDPSIIKFTVKVSYAEIYNETVNDLVDPKKKNLEIRESIAKGVFVNNLTETVVQNAEKVLQILNEGERNRVIAETKFNEKSSRSHTIFRVKLEFDKKDPENSEIVKSYHSQLNLIDLAGSENVTKAKCEGIRLKEGANINKSLLALSGVINKLSQSSKNFVNFRDSKLTRLLQPALSGNSKTAIICTIIDDNYHYQETLNTLHFGLKAQNIKTKIKVNEIMDDKNKILMENNQLKNTIKMLQDMIVEKQETININHSTNSIMNTAMKNEERDNSEQINALEKEVSLLKRLLINNQEEIGEDRLSTSLNNDRYSITSGTNIGGSLYHNLMQTAYKPSFNSFNCFSSAVKSESCFANPNDNYHDLTNPNNFRKSCLTELRNLQLQNSFLKSNNKLGQLAQFGQNNMDYEGGTFGNEILIKENEELKRKIYEMKKSYYEIVQSKENQIKLLSQNHNAALENCLKLIKEAEENYLNLKLNFDQCQDDLKKKDNEINELKTKMSNQDSLMNYYKQEVEKNKDINFIDDFEQKNSSLGEEVMGLKKEKEVYLNQIEGFKTEINDLNEKLSSKTNEADNLKKQMENFKKSTDREISKLKEKIRQNPNVGNALYPKPNDKKNKNYNKVISDLESKYSKMENENKKYKSKLQKIEQEQILEYQNLLEESFSKITELNDELNSLRERNGLLEEELKKYVYNNNDTPFMMDMTTPNYGMETPNKDKENINTLNLPMGDNKKANLNLLISPNIKEDLGKGKGEKEYLGKKRYNERSITKDNKITELNFDDEISNFQI
ncbi:MAG: hypothetical protein MJ252_21775 [archaeon]|nr:hypothetical protein [archaeon]